MEMEVRWPATWVGTWVAADGKTVVVEPNPTGSGVTVTVAPAPHRPPYVKDLLDGTAQAVGRLPAACIVDGDGRRCLEIEAGTVGVGPTYRLHAMTDGPTGRWLAPSTAAVADVVLVPNTVIGLYDDHDDDQGVPWAHPLQPLRWAATTGGDGPQGDADHA